MAKLVEMSPSELEIQKLLSGDITWFAEEINSKTPCLLEAKIVERRKVDRRLLFLIDKIWNIAVKHFSKNQQKKIIKAIRYASEKHKDVYRKDGKTPYLLHPLEVANILIDLGIYDFKLIVAAILHDVPEDTSSTQRELVIALREVNKEFGAGVKNIVALVTVPPDSLQDVSFISFMRKGAETFFEEPHEQMIETVVISPIRSLKKEKYWTAIKKEADLACRWRVIVLKLGDRIHNMRTLGVMPNNKKKHKILETKQEFPELYDVLIKTISKLKVARKLKNKNILEAPHKLRNLLEKEMGKYLLTKSENH